MAKTNLVMLFGRVHSLPTIFTDDDGNCTHGFMHVDVVRSQRKVEDKQRHTKHDYPMLISREKLILDQWKELGENDIVLIKGVLCTTRIPKTNVCPHCNEKNRIEGQLVYVTPIAMTKIRSFDSKEDARKYVVENNEFSNVAQIYGTLLKDPKIFVTKTGVQVTQYPIAMNRKFTIRTDDPTIRTDYPVVKSYGEIARTDKTYLKYQSEVLIDGCLQARTIQRNCKCPHCGEFYTWNDNAMEIVPYAVEYIENFRNDDEVKTDFGLTAESYKQMLYRENHSDDPDDEMKTDDII